MYFTAVAPQYHSTSKDLYLRNTGLLSGPVQVT